MPKIQVRACRCMACDAMWVATVELSKNTTNLSGEKTRWCPNCGGRAAASSPVQEIEVGDKYGESVVKQMMDSAGMRSPQDLLDASDAEHAGFDFEKVGEMLQRFKVGSPPLTSPVRRLAEHTVRLEARLTPITPGQKVEVTPKSEPVRVVVSKECLRNSQSDLLAHKIADASSVISMGASVSENRCADCEAALSDDHPNPESQREWYEAGNHVCHRAGTVTFKVPLPPPGQPNANGDVFSDGLQIPQGTKVRHEDKVVGEVAACGDNKAVVRFVRSEEEFEVQTGIFEIKPDGGIPGVVGIRVDTSGVPIIFNTMTDNGNHARVLRHAKYVLQSILVKEKVE